MKLYELDALNKQSKVEQILEKRLGKPVSFKNLKLHESRQMLKRVTDLINEHKASAAFHTSETDPAYLRLIMIEQGLKDRIAEEMPVPTTGAQPAKPGQPAVAVDPKDPKVQAAMKKSQSGQTLTPDEQKLVGALAATTMQKESMSARRRLRESEIQQAQVVLAAQDMVDQIQKMLEQISAMQFKDLPALTDSIKNDMGVEQATAYQSAAAAALTQLLQSVQQGKTALEGAQGTLTGQAPIVPGEEPAADMGADVGADLGADLNAEPVPTDDEEDLNPMGGEEELGRERRGVAEAKKAKPDFLDMDKDGNKKEPMKKAIADKKKKIAESFGKADYARIAKIKAKLMKQGMEPEEAEEEAADQLGYDYEEVLDWIQNSQLDESSKK